MKKNRRSFLKFAGLTAAGSAVLPGCGQISSQAEAPSDVKDWTSDPEWREVKYGGWKGPGVSEGKSPMDHVLLRNYAPKSSLISTETMVPKCRFAAIDVHVHHYPARAKETSSATALDQWVNTQIETGVEKSIVLTGATGEDFDRLVDFYLAKYPDRFQLYCGLEHANIHKSDYPERAARELERCYKQGARGVGELQDKGFGLTRDSKLAPEGRLHADDARLDPFWQTCARLKLPVNIHIADHPSAWKAPDVFQERTPVFQQYNNYGGTGLTHEELIATLPRLLKKHPQTTYIACHLANLGHDLRRLANILDEFQNLFVDISARDYEVGRQPRAAAKFLQLYSKRVLFGTDMGMEKTMYQSWWRLLETADEHMEGRVWWRYYGLELPEGVLSDLYRDNAIRILNWS